MKYVMLFEQFNKKWDDSWPDDIKKMVKDYYIEMDDKKSAEIASGVGIHSKEFKDWFGDWEEAYKTNDYSDCSKIINKDGTPKVVEHATRRDFDKFDKTKPGGANHDMGTGLYFSDHQNIKYWIDYVETGTMTDSNLYTEWIFKFKFGIDMKDKSKHMTQDTEGVFDEGGLPFTSEFIELAKKYKIDLKNIKSADFYNKEQLKSALTYRATKALNLKPLNKVVVKYLYVNGRNVKFVKDGYDDRREHGTEEKQYDVKIEGTLDNISQGVVFEPNDNIRYKQ